MQIDVSFQVSSNFLNHEEQTTAQMATLGQEMTNLRSELQEHRINAVERTTRPIDPNKKEDKMIHDFVFVATQMDILRAGTARKYNTMN